MRLLFGFGKHYSGPGMVETIEMQNAVRNVPQHAWGCGLVPQGVSTMAAPYVENEDGG